MLTPERVDVLWPDMDPLFKLSCESNAVGNIDICPDDIYLLAKTEQCVIFTGLIKDRPACVLAIQFTETNGKKGADVIAMAGKHLVQFKARYWEPILDWLRANGVQFLDAYANDRMASIYTSKFGFDRSCTMLRMVL